MRNSIMSSSNKGNGVAGRAQRASLLATVIGALAASAALAGPQLGTIEECLETGTDLVSLPGVAGGTLSAKQCTACDTHRLSFSEATRYYIGQEAVPYTRFRTAASKGPMRLYVFYQPQTQALTRLRLVAGNSSQ